MIRHALIATIFATLPACVSEGEPGGTPELAAALDDSQSSHTSRTVSVYLVADNLTGYSPQYSDRLLVAEPVVQRVSRQAKAKLKVDGIDTVVYGESCTELSRRYEAVISCEISETVTPDYLHSVASASTDSEGFAIFTLDSRSYRISLESWPTLEDPLCQWGGSAMLADQQTSLAINVMVFCE